ncbi:MAG: anti-sigma factor [Planctomycetota bacterium]|nr:MAG: anti-sigma factor [Planctomycetota bacterium]
MSDSSRDNPQSLPAAALIRLVADGELTADQQPAFEHMDSDETAGRVRFERRLRSAVADAMRDVAVPTGLADRVMRAVEAEDRLEAGLSARAEQTRERSFWLGRRLFGAVAAVLVFAIGGLLIVQAASVSRLPLDSSQLAYRQELASFVAREHNRCCQDEHAARQKLRITDEGQAAEKLTERLGRPIKLPFGPGEHVQVRFEGAGPCGIPGKGPSAHLMYDPAVGPKVSIFIKADSGELPFEPGRTYLLDSRKCGLAGTRVLAWVEQGVVYYAVFEEGPGCEQIFEELGLKTPSARF